MNLEQKRDFSTMLWLSYRNGTLDHTKLPEPRRGQLKELVGYIASVFHLSDTIASEVSKLSPAGSFVDHLKGELAYYEASLTIVENRLYG